MKQSPNGPLVSNLNSVGPTSATTYFLIGENANNYLDTTSLTISLYAAPSPNLSDLTICSDGTTSLDPGSLAQYGWSSGENTQSINKGAGTYTVTVQMEMDVPLRPVRRLLNSLLVWIFQ